MHKYGNSEEVVPSKSSKLRCGRLCLSREVKHHVTYRQYTSHGGWKDSSL